MTFTADMLEKYAKAAAVVFCVLAVCALCLVVFRAKKIAGKTSKGRNIFYSILSVILAGVIIAANVITPRYSSSISSAFTKAAQADPSTETTMDDWISLVTDIADEGMVLLKNENNTLPLEAGTAVNVLGYAAYNPFLSGSGSGSVSADDSVTVVSSLTEAGFDVNPAPGAVDMWPKKPEDTNPFGYNDGDLMFGDPSIDSYTGEISFDSLKEYADTAVVVIGRSGGEGYDLTAYTDADYLQLTQNEIDLLRTASDTFDRLIVILNMANAIQLDALQDIDIDAIIWTGLPGPYGFTSLGRIMNGTVNPSGHLPDTWVYDHDSNPARENFGEQAASNADSYYVDYVEGIYVGYKWYETAAAEKAVITNTKSGETFDYADYESIVAYPFGYGLSYTTFEQKFENVPDQLDPQGSLSFDVTVTNTGDIAGKDAVQLYVTAPYTDYDQANQVEKAAISLCGIAKTGEIAPGASETVTIEVRAEDIASYNSSYENTDGTRGAYMLDQGSYTFLLGKNAHTAYETTDITLTDDYFYTGDQKRNSDSAAAENAFEDAARGEYLSRKDAFANYESAMKSVSDAVESTDWEDNTNQYDPALDEAVAKTYEKGKDYASKGHLTLEDVAGLDFDDPMWDELISQLTIPEMQALVTDALYKTPNVESIGKGGTTDSDGPLGISSFFNPAMNSVAYPCLPILSGSFNADLARTFGELVSDQAHNKGVSGWYAPAMDTHRTAYSGRNFEYYSEDGWLGAVIAAATVSGARDHGMIVYIKHFALNDQESQRSGNLHTYSNEQAIREIYLKPFEYAVKDGGANAIMTSMNYIGDTYAGGHAGLLENVLRGEWNFKGKSLTDMDEAGEAVNVDKCMRAGTDSWLSVSPIAMVSDPSDADIYYLQRAAKNILYPEANSKTYQAQVVNWRGYMTFICCMLGLIIAALVLSMILRNRKPVSKK
ncbi:MAG: glycoside hydrolase family 3 C-terminal domain-containing protein [Eubacteriales bacterium]|nr:glycoside hydrolase family 3 C-terminal domain-containing protein [Eubacteriales bacterium]